MNTKRVMAIARNELAQVVRSKDYLLPLGMLSLIFFVVIPFILLSVIGFGTDNETAEAIGAVIDSLPQAAQENVQGDTPEAQAAFSLAVYLLAPIAIVVPLTVANAVGATAIVGERERGTGEFLAHSPATETELYLGKLIASLVPGYVATIGGFGLYSLVVNVTSAESLGGWFFPTTDWWILIFWVVPPFLAVALSVIVAISARVKTAAAAQQASQLITLPVILLAYGIASGLLFSSVTAALIIGALAWIAAVIGLARGRHAIDRERLVGVDT